MVNKLTMKSDVHYFLTAKTYELSELTPFIRVYKYYADGREVEFKFPTHISPSGDLSDFLNDSLQRGIGLGVESFTWNKIGQNQITAKTDIDATLVLYAQNFNELLKIRTTVDTKGQEQEYKIIDLLVRQPEKVPQGENRNAFDPKFYTMKIAAGYGHSQGGTVVGQGLQRSKIWGDLGRGLEDRSGFTNAIKNMTEVFMFGVKGYTLDIKDDGSIRVSISLQLRSEMDARNLDADVLASPQVIAARAARKQRLEAHRSKWPDPASGEPRAKESGEILETMKFIDEEERRLERRESFRNLLNRLAFSEQEGSLIYNVTLGPAEEVKVISSTLDENGDRVEEEKTVWVYPPQGAARSSNVDASTALTAAELSQAELGGPLRPAHEFLFMPGGRNISFFFLGDLIKVAFDSALFSTQTMKGTGSLENVKILLAPFDYKDFKTGKIRRINIADIPISVELFSSFLRDKVIDADRDNYALMDFIRDVLNDLVFESIGGSCGTGAVSTNFDTFQVSVPSMNGEDPLMLRRAGPLEAAGLPAPEGVVERKVIDFDSIKSNLDGESDLLFPEPGSPVSADDMYHYILLKPTNVKSMPLASAPANLTERYRQDYERGIYHLAIGQPDGILKGVTFSKSNIKGLQSVRFVLSDDDPYAQLGEVHNVDIRMIGNSLFDPGKTLFLNPRSMGSSLLGDPTYGAAPGGVPRSYSNLMGIGGYFLITKVSSTITNGNYETTVTAYWNSAGDGERSAYDAQDEIIGGSPNG